MVQGFFGSRTVRTTGRHLGRFPRARPALEMLETRTLLSFIAPINQNFRGFDNGGIATGDFLGNHIQDVAVVSSGENSVNIFLGNGDGTFQAPRVIPIGPDGFAVAAADLTHSGHDDLVITHFNEGDPQSTVSVLLSNGDGTFQPPVNYQAGDNPHSIAIGDFNGDGVPDLVVPNEGFFFHDQFQAGTTVTVLLGNGDGTFQPPRTFDTGVTPETVAVGDFTGDGKLSIVTADEGFDIPGDVAFLRGNGDGTFQEPVFLDLGTFGGSAARSVAVADLTGNGRLDIVATTNSNDIFGQGGVSVIMGNGDGTFQPAVTYAANTGNDSLPLHVVLGDFNGDGKPDIAVNSFLGSAAGVDVLVNNGDGTFQAPTPVNSEAFGTSVMAVGDFTGDGSSDLAVASSDVLSIVLRQPGALLKTPTILTTGPGTTSLQTADLNRDGHPDLVFANGQTNSVQILLGNGDGTFQPPAFYPVGASPQEVIVVDLLHNGILDLVAVNQGDRTLSVLLGNGDGTFQPAQTLFLAAPGNFVPVRVVAGDFEHDGLVDLVVLAQDTSGGGSGLITLHGNGDGSFTPLPVQNEFAQVNDILGRITFEAADLRGSGNLDLVLATGQAGSAVVYPGNGDGTFGAPRLVRLGTDQNDGVTGIALADLRGTGTLDIVASVFNFFRSDNVIVALGNGDGTFGAPTRFQAAGAATSVVVGDFNRDGIPDIAVTEQGLLGGASNGNSMSVLAGNGDGTFGAATNYDVAGTPANLVTADFNGEGAPDLALFNRSSGNISVVFNANDGRTPHPSGVGPARAPVGVGGLPALPAADLLPEFALVGPTTVAVSRSTRIEQLQAVHAVFALATEDQQTPHAAPSRTLVTGTSADAADVFQEALFADLLLSR